MNHFDGIDISVLRRGAERVDNLRRGGYLNAMFSDVEDRALDGQALMFNVPFNYKDTVVMFKPGAFGRIDDYPVGFQIDHLPSSQVASTEDGLEIVVDDDAVKFRLHLDRAKRGSVIAKMCEVGNRDAISVGCDILDERTENIVGHDVRVISRARLSELSLVKMGAAPDAFAMVVDTTVTSKPVAGKRSATFEAGHALHKCSRKIKALKSAVVAMYDSPRHDVQPRKPTSVSIHQMNRWQTEETEALVAYSKRMHGVS
jgi:phage head maturation protease